MKPRRHIVSQSNVRPVGTAGAISNGMIPLETAVALYADIVMKKKASDNYQPCNYSQALIATCF